MYYIVNADNPQEKSFSYLDYSETYHKLAEMYCTGFLKEGQIIRESDGFVMYDTRHNEYLRNYEMLDTEKWAGATEFWHKHSSKPSVYIDVDGTAAYWYKDGRGFSYPEQILDPKNHYYRDLEPHMFIVNLARELQNEGLDVCILSATDRPCIPDRFEWIEKNMPFIPKENICLCPIGADKSKFCKGNADKSILIDDYEFNLVMWEKSGGVAVKSVNSVNSPTRNFRCIDTYNIEKGAENGYSLQDLDEWVNSLKNLTNELAKSKNKSKDFSVCIDK